MQKAKFMLVIILVVASVAGALAFKLKKNGTWSYCYAITNSEPAASECTLSVTNAHVNGIGTGEKIYYTTVFAPEHCSLLWHFCPYEGHLPFNN